VRSDDGVSTSTEEYLEWIYRLSKEQEKVTTSDLARSIGVSPASVSGMLKRLSERGFLDYTPYRHVSLTDEGRRVGARIIRRHGLLERLLCDVLAFPWHKVDDAVRHIAPHITDEVEARLDSFLGHPKTCPHGQPIDWADAASAIRLSTMSPGEIGIISRIGDETPAFLEHVQGLGLMPQVAVTLIGAGPFGGPLVVQVGEQQHAIGNGVADNIWIERDSIRELPGAPA